MTRPYYECLHDFCFVLSQCPDRSSYRVENVEREPADAEHESHPDEEVARPLHPQDVVLDPLHDHMLSPASTANATRAPSAVAVVADHGRVGGQLAELLLHSDAELPKDLVVGDGDGDRGEEVLDQHRHRGVNQPSEK